MSGAHYEQTIQKQIQQDWANREYIEIITGSIKKIADFLNSFGSYFLHEKRLVYSLMNIFYVIRYVLSRQAGQSQWEADNTWAENRIFGGPSK